MTFKHDWILDAMGNGYTRAEAAHSYAQQEYAEPVGGSGSHDWQYLSMVRETVCTKCEQVRNPHLEDTLCAPSP